MSRAVAVPRHMTAKKPPHGHACNRCGACCYISLCPLGKHVFGRDLGPCPALFSDLGGSSCGLTVHPELWSAHRVVRWSKETVCAAARMIIGAGTGCDARINGEARNEPFYQKLRIWDRKHKDEIALARKIWGI